MTALLSMYEKWVKAASSGQLSGVVLVDLSAAFDLVSPELLIKKLEIYGFDESTRQWILSYLTDRRLLKEFSTVYFVTAYHCLVMVMGETLQCFKFCRIELHMLW